MTSTPSSKAASVSQGVPIYMSRAMLKHIQGGDMRVGAIHISSEPFGDDCVAMVPASLEAPSLGAAVRHTAILPGENEEDYICRLLAMAVARTDADAAVPVVVDVADYPDGSSAPVFAAVPASGGVEAVAKAICRQEGLHPDDTGLEGEPYWEDYCPHARAAITAYWAQADLSPAQTSGSEEVIAALLAEKPFVFDPATNFAHADDGGAPDHGTLWVPVERAAQTRGAEAGGEAVRTAPLLKDGDVVERLKQFRLRWQEGGDLTYLGKALTDAVVLIEALAKPASEPAGRAREATARVIYKEMGFSYDGRTVNALGVPYGSWAKALKAADAIAALSAPASSSPAEAEAQEAASS